MHTLYISLTSPFARMARVVVREKRLQDRVQERVVNPFDNPVALIAANPAGLVPALERDDGGRPIFDSRLICGWLDHLPSDAMPLIPESGPERLAARQGEALAQILCDRAVAMNMEKRRPAEFRYEPYLTRWREQMLRMVEAIPGEVAAQAQPISMTALMLACALSYLDFRHPEMEWRALLPDLANWHDDISARDSLASTAPEE